MKNKFSFKELKNGLLSNKEFFDTLYKVLTCIALSVTVAPFTISTFRMVPVPGFMLLIATVMITLAGWLFQAVYGTVAGVKREQYIGSYEKGVKYFKPGHAVLTTVIGVIFGFIARHVVDRYLYNLAITTGTYIYDSNSLLPWMVMFAVFIPYLAGVVLWFYPYDRVISSRSIFVFLAVFFIWFVLGAPTQMITICLIIFLLCAVIVLNQSYILRLVERTKVGSFTPQMRFYNIALVILMLLLASLTLFFVVTIVVGFVVLFRILLYFVLASVLRDDSASYQKADKVADAASDEIFKGFADMAGGTNIVFYFIFFCMMIFAAIIFFIIVRKVDIFKYISRFLSALYNNILAFLVNAFYFNRTVNTSVEYVDYTDDEKSIDKRTYTSARASEFKPRKTYRDFMHRLNSMKTYPEKLNYAYNTLVSFWKTMDMLIRPADTPFEIGEKVKGRADIKRIDEITARFEQIKYADNDAADEAVLEEICSLVRKYYD